ncbi:hypothetical protein D3C87_2113560 [compost metagenome]
MAHRRGENSGDDVDNDDEPELDTAVTPKCTVTPDVGDGRGSGQRIGTAVEPV